MEEDSFIHLFCFPFSEIQAKNPEKIAAIMQREHKPYASHVHNLAFTLCLGFLYAPSPSFEELLRRRLMEPR